MSLVWVNGELVDKAAARVSPFDHGFLYGDGVWEHLRVFGGKLFRPEFQLGRLFGTAETVELPIPHTPAELTAAIEATVRANHRTDGYARVIVSRGPGTVGPDPRKIDPQVFIIAEEYQPFPAELYGHGLHAACTAMPDGGPARLRVLGCPEVVEAKRQALRAGCLEAVLVDADEAPVCTTEGSLFWVRGGRTFAALNWSPDAAAEVVTETTGAVLGEGVRVDDLIGAADELFIAGTSCGIIGIVRLDGQDIGTGTEGPMTKAVREAYHKLTRGASQSTPGDAPVL